jgi:hypothetical protein
MIFSYRNKRFYHLVENKKAFKFNKNFFIKKIKLLLLIETIHILLIN